MARTFLTDVITEWELEKSIKVVAMDKAEDKKGSINLLFADLKNLHLRYHNMVGMFHVRCIAHVVNLAVKEAISAMYSYVSRIRSILISVLSLIRRRKIFPQLEAKMECKTKLPMLDCNTRW